MPHYSLPKEVREYLARTNSVSLRVVLQSPCWAEGSVIFDQPDEGAAIRGDFFPAKTKVVISEAVSGQFLLAKSSILLNVTLTPGRMKGTDVEHCRFEIVGWNPLVETIEG